MFDFFSTKGFRSYTKQAQKILDSNWTGRYTRPAPNLYPHQWSWDSGFIAIGYAHYNEDRAMNEIRFLFDHQWDNGMVPQIVFNPAALGNYFPEPEFWQVPGGRLTSGITMPPIHATTCLHIYEHAKNRKNAHDFLKKMFPQLKASHRYFYRYRNPDKTGLVYIRHPWESGLDNSPSWDNPMTNIRVNKTKLPAYERKDLNHGVPAEQRPGDGDYDRYVYLVDLFRRNKYDETEIYQQCPFLIQDVMFNSILCRANHDLIEIGKIIDHDTKEIEEWNDQTSQAIQNRMWSPERKQFDSLDLVSGQHLSTATAASFMPLFAVAASQEQAGLLYQRLNSVSFCALNQGNCFTIPNYDMARDDFDSKNYWRGPVWININWMLSQGLRSYGYKEKSESMKKDLIQLPVRFGFYEYFDSISGKGYGSNAFSWTSALFIDLIYEYYDQDKKMLIWFPRGNSTKLKEKLILNHTPKITTDQGNHLASRLMSAIGDLKATFYDMHRGLVDYRAIKSSDKYRAYLELAAHLKSFDLQSLKSREDKLAFWINIYNTIVVQGIIELELESSVREVTNFFTHICYRIGRYTFSPDEIEHGILRSNARPPYSVFKVFKRNDPRSEFALDKSDPRIHFVLVCGSRSCAPIRFYQANVIDEQLDTATKNFINSSEVVILPEKNKVLLSQIFHWYNKDLGKGKDLYQFLLRYLNPDEKAEYLEEHIDTIEVEYLFYDWNLNH
jgi:hypothetical protein